MSSETQPSLSDSRPRRRLGAHIDVRSFSYDAGDGLRRCVKVSAGHLGRERIVPPAGEEHAFYVDNWRREVEVYVSPTGRSVRVYVDGKEVTQ